MFDKYVSKKDEKYNVQQYLNKNAWLLMLSSMNFSGFNKMHKASSTARAGQGI